MAAWVTSFCEAHIDSQVTTPWELLQHSWFHFHKSKSGHQPGLGLVRASEPHTWPQHQLPLETALGFFLSTPTCSAATVAPSPDSGEESGLLHHLHGRCRDHRGLSKPRASPGCFGVSSRKHMMPSSPMGVCAARPWSPTCYIDSRGTSPPVLLVISCSALMRTLATGYHVVPGLSWCSHVWGLTG